MFVYYSLLYDERHFMGEGYIDMFVIILCCMRLSSHNLAIETGRWARVAPDQRLCACGAVQTEEHVICDCPYTGVIRADYPTISFANIVRFFQSNHIGAMCNVVSRTLRVFEN